MDDLNIQDENVFTQDQIDKIGYDIVESVLAGQGYQEEKVKIWVNTICEKIVEQLTSTERSYKYMVNCLIMQRNGAGVSTCASCHWDTVTDFISQQVWPKEKQSKDLQSKNQMQCILTIYIISII